MGKGNETEVDFDALSGPTCEGSRQSQEPLKRHAERLWLRFS